MGHGNNTNNEQGTDLGKEEQGTDLGKEVSRDTPSEILGVHNNKTISSENEKEESKNKKPLVERIFNYAKAVLLASLLLAIGGPLGIALGLIIFAFVFRKPIVGTIKNFIKKVAKRVTSVSEKIKEKIKSFLKKKTKMENNLKNPKNNLRKVAKTTKLEMNKGSLRKMSTRADGVSFNVLPKNQSKSTFNNLKLVESKFYKLTKPSVELSGDALKRSNTFPRRKYNSPKRIINTFKL